MKKRVAVYLISFGLALAASTAIADVFDGVNWLDSVAAGDGSISSPASPATPFQSTEESLLAFSAAGRPLQPSTSAAAQYVTNQSFDSTEYLSRKIAVGRLYGGDVSLLVAGLVASQRSDGGFGETSAFESTSLDTGFALQVLDPGSPAASRSLDFLLPRQNADGGFPLGNSGDSSAYATAVVIRALQRQQTLIDISQVIDRAIVFVISCQEPSGGWGSDWETAFALRALIPVEADSSVWSAAADQLRAAQQVSGAWSDDAYTTALAIQALVLADQAAVIVIPDTGSVTGRLVSTVSGLPVVGATITVNGIADPNSASDLDGIFRVAGVAPGSATIDISASGFEPATIIQSIVVDEVASLGEIGLIPTPGTAFVSGRITDASSGLGVSGAIVTLDPDVGDLQDVTTNARGDYSIALEPSAFTITVNAPTYATVATSGSIAADEHLNFGVQLAATGTAPNSVTQIAGRVIDSITLQPIADASINVDAGAVNATTDADGRFTADVAAAGVASLNISASGYLPGDLEVLTATGSRTDIGTVYLVNVQPIATSTIAGVVRDAESFAPIANAEVRIDSANLNTHTGVDGTYVLNGIPSLSFTVQVQAVGYLGDTQTINLVEPGFQSVDYWLTQAGSPDLKVVSVATASGRSVIPALDSEQINLVLENTGSNDFETQLFSKLIDANGVTVRRLPIVPIDQVGFFFVNVPALSTAEVSFQWDSERLAPGEYSLVVQAFDPDTGQLLSERSIGLTVAETRRVGGQIEFDPPITQLGSNEPVRVTAKLVNEGNVTIGSDSITTTVTLRNGGDARARDLLSTRVFVEQPDLSSPQGMDLDDQGNLYVADSGLDAIVRITPTGTASVVADPLNNPVDVDIGATGMHVAEANRYVFVGFDGSRREEALTFNPVAVEAMPNGSVMLSAGNGVYELVGGIGPAILRLNQGLSAPTGISLRADDSIVIADGTNGIWELSNGIFRPLRTDVGRVSDVTIASDGTIYFTDVVQGTLSRIEADNSVTLVASGLSGLVGLEVAANGNILVGSSISNEILEITPAGAQSVLAYSPILSPSAGAVDSTGRTLFVGQDQTIYALDSSDTFSEVTNLTFQPTAMDIGPGDSMALAGGNQLVVLDSAGSQIQQTTLSFSVDGIAAGTEIVATNTAGGLVSVDAAGAETNFLPELGTPRNAISAPGGAVYLLTDNGFLVRQEADATFSIIEQGLSNPTGLTVDVNGDIYITEQTTRRIRRITPTGGITEVLTTSFAPSGIAVLGPDDFLVSVLNDTRIFRVDQTGETLIATLGLPIDNEILIASDGAVWVTHPNQSRITRLDLATSNAVTVSASSGGGGGGLSAGSAGDVFLAERGRVRRFFPDGSAEPAVFITGLPFGSGGSRTTGLVPSAAGGWWFYQSNDFAYEIDSTDTVVQEYIATVVADDVTFLPNGDLAIATPLGVGAVSGPMTLPRRVAPEAVGRLAAESSTSVVATSVSTVRRIDLATATSTVLQSGFRRLSFVGIAANGNIVIGDQTESRLLTLNTSGNIVNDIIGIDRPSAISLAPDGTVYVATDGTTSHIVSLSPTGLPTRFSTLRSVDAMAIKSDGSMVASDNTELFNLDANGAIVSRFREYGVTGLAATTTDTILGTNSFDGTLMSINEDLTFDVLASGVGSIVDIESLPNGELQYIDYDAGSVGRLVDGGGTAVSVSGLAALAALAVNDDGTRTVLNRAGSLYEIDAGDQLTKLATRGQLPGNTRGLARQSKETIFVSQPRPSRSRPTGSTVYQTTIELAGESTGDVGEVVFTATVPFTDLLMSAESVLVDFGVFTPAVSGDYTASAVISSGSAGGELTNQLHVGPGADAALSLINDQVGLGDVVETAVLSLSGGGASSVFQLDLDAPIQMFQNPVRPPFDLIGSMTGDSAGNIFVSKPNYSGTNSGEISKISPDGSSQLFAEGLNLDKTITIDNDDNLYFGASYFGDIHRMTPDGTVSVIANVAANSERGIVTGIDFTTDGQLAATTWVSTALKISLDGSNVQEVGRTLGSFNESLAVDGDGNYYTFTSKLGEVRQIEPYSSVLDLVSLSRITPDGDVETVLANTGSTGNASFGVESDSLTRDCSGDILMAARVLNGVESPTVDEVYQLSRRTGAVRTVLNGLSIDPRFAQIRAISYDRLGERLLVETGYVPGTGLPNVDIWAIRAGCGGVEADVHVISRSDVDLTNADPAPDTAVDLPDGTREFVWNISSTEAQVDIDLSLLLRELTEGEQRPIFTEAFIEFTNTFLPGESVRVPIEIPSVFAAGRIAVDLSTTGSEFGPNTDVPLTTVVQNLGNDAFNGSLTFVVEDNSGNVVTTVASSAITSLPAQQSTTISGNWNTGTTFAGGYTIRAEVVDTGQDLVASDTTGVNLLPGGGGTTQAVATLLTDRASYEAWDTVNMTARLQNTTFNAILPGTSTVVSVSDPSGAIVFSANGTFGELQPGQLLQYPVSFALSDAGAGQYAVLLTATDAVTGAGIAVGSTTFAVSRTESSGLRGNVAAEFKQVQTGIANSCTFTTDNISATPIADVTLTYRTVNLDTQAVVSETSESVTIPANGQQVTSIAADTTGLAEGAYACLLSATVAGETKELAGAAFGVVSDSLVVATSVTTDRVAYEALDTAMVSTEVRNLSAQASGPLSVTTTIFAPDGSNFDARTDQIADLDGGAAVGVMFTVPFGQSPPGQYRLMSSVVAPDGVELASDEITVSLLSTNDTGAGIGASISVSPDPVVVDETVELTAVISNSGNAPVTALPLTWRIVDSVTQEVITEFSSNVQSLAVNSTSTDVVSWIAAVAPDTTVDVSLLADFNGVETLLGSTQFLVNEQLVDIDATVEFGSRGRLLVLMDPASGEPPVDDEREFLETLLQAEGWSYTLVTNAGDFTAEFDSGMYSEFALFSASVKLSNATQIDLVDAVLDGAGLAVAGDHDSRNSKLDPALGVKAIGNLPAAIGFSTQASALFTDAAFDFQTGIKTRTFKLEGAEVVGTYDGTGAAEPAVTTYEFADGKSVTAGFDLLAEAYVAGDASLLRDFLAQVIDFPHPAQVSVVPGVAMPIELIVTNVGVETPGRAVIYLPAELVVADEGLTTTVSPVELQWDFDLGVDESETVTFWVIVPFMTATILIDVQSGVEADFVDEESLIFVIDPGP